MLLFKKISRWKYGKSDSTLQRHTKEIRNILNAKCHEDTEKISQTLNKLHAEYVKPKHIKPKNFNFVVF